MTKVLCMYLFQIWPWGEPYVCLATILWALETMVPLTNSHCLESHNTTLVLTFVLGKSSESAVIRAISSARTIPKEKTSACTHKWICTLLYNMPITMATIVGWETEYEPRAQQHLTHQQRKLQLPYRKITLNWQHTQCVYKQGLFTVARWLLCFKVTDTDHDTWNSCWA